MTNDDEAEEGDPMTEEDDKARATAIALAGELASNPSGWGLTPQQLGAIASWLLDVAVSEESEAPIEALTVLVAKLHSNGDR